MNTNPSVVKMPWKKVGFGYILTVKLISVPENFFNDETKEPNSELLQQAISSLDSMPPVMQVSFYKNEEQVSIQDLYSCILQKYKDSYNDPKINEITGLILDALKNIAIINKDVGKNVSTGIHSIFNSFINKVLDETLLGNGTITYVEGHICFINLIRSPFVFLPSSVTKLSEQDRKA